MSWDLSSEEVIVDKLESQQRTIEIFSKKLIELAKYKQAYEILSEANELMIREIPHYEDCDSEDPDDEENCNCGRNHELKRYREAAKKVEEIMK